MERGTVLVVDDDELIRETLRLDLLEQGYLADAVASGEEALAMLPRRYDLIITDLIMEGVNGLEVLRQAKALDPACAVIIITGHREVEAAIGALRLGANDYLMKPYGYEEMLERVATCFRQKGDRRGQQKTDPQILSICSDCKKIRSLDKDGGDTVEWVSVEHFLHQIMGTELSHGICPDCYQQKMAELTELIRQGQLFRPS